MINGSQNVSQKIVLQDVIVFYKTYSAYEQRMIPITELN